MNSNDNVRFAQEIMNKQQIDSPSEPNQNNSPTSSEARGGDSCESHEAVASGDVSDNHDETKFKSWIGKDPGRRSPNADSRNLEEEK